MTSDPDDGGAARVRVAILASGTGTNLQALVDACGLPGFPAAVAVVVSDRADAYALERARRCGIPAVHVARRGLDRAGHDAACVEVLRAHGVQWVCLAGYMRLLTPTFLGAFPDRVLNVHPSLLPGFPGLDAQRRALEAGVRLAGCTIHLVDDGTDTGPIVAQGAVPVFPTDDVPALQHRILRMEHLLYPRVLEWAAEGRIRVEPGAGGSGRRVVVDGVAANAVWAFDPRP